MDFTTSNLLVPTNSRRRTKGRLAFIDSAEHTYPNEDGRFENEMNIPENELEYDFTENVDDVDEEQVTIDLSEFLNENPLLTEPSEHLADSGAAVTDCHSQFRVTTSLADPTPVAIQEISSQKDSNVNEIVTEKCLDITETESIPSTLPVSEMPPNVLSENKISIDSTKIPSDTVANISLHKENILTGLKSSPNKNHKAKSTKATNLFQKYKNASRLKDFNKNNMKVFGKYPVVKCEKLDIERFIKTNSIKVGNWPIRPTNNHFKTKSLLNKSNVNRKYKSQSNKVPKLLNKPISFNRCVPNSRNISTVNKARSILIDALAANSSPLIIKTDNWKPEVASLTGGTTKFLNSENFQLSAQQKCSKPLGNQRIIKLVHASSPLQMNKLTTQTKKLPIITSVNKVNVGPKTFQLVSPNTFVASKPDKSKPVTPILPKPNPELMSSVFLKDYTVIQPYVEDPTSPVKPKPLLTVPLDILPVTNAFNQPELIAAATEIHSPIKSPLKLTKPVQSVFLNGAINRISSPVVIGKVPSAINVTESVKYNEETTLSKNMNKANAKSNTDLPVMSSKSTMIDAMKSIFSKPQVIRKQPKNKQNHPRSNRRGDGSILECQAYNTTLNDMLFSDFTDESYSLDDSVHISSDICSTDAEGPDNTVQTSHIYQSDQNKVHESSIESSSVKEKHEVKEYFKQKYNRKKIPSPHDSDTLSASEGEEENKKQKLLSNTKRKDKTLRINTLHNYKESTESSTNVTDGKQKMSSEKLVGDTSNNDAESTEKSDILPKKTELVKSSENSPESEEKCLSSDKSSSSNPSLEISCSVTKSETISISDTTLQIDKKSNDPLDGAQEKFETVQESKIGVSNLRNRHKTECKGKTAAALVKGKRIGYVHAKFKINSKKMSNNKVLQNNKKSSRPSDIIKEIKTITGGGISSKRLREKETSVVEKANHSSSAKNVSTRAKSESKTKIVSKAPKQSKKSLAVRSKTKKRIKTLKVLFKRPTSKSKSLEIPFDDINDDDDELLDNENDPNSLSENNTNLNSTFRDAKSHKMGTPSKEEHNCDADVFSSKLKSNDSLKENETLSNGIDGESSLESSVLTEGGDSIHGESNNITSEELKSCDISDKAETIEDAFENKKLNEINVSKNQQESDLSGNENLSSFHQEKNSVASSDSNLAMSATGDLSNKVSEEPSDLNLTDNSPTENSVVSVCRTDIIEDINEDKIPPSEVDVKNTLKDHKKIVPTCENVCKSDNNVLPEDQNPNDNAYSNSSENISLPEVIEDSPETADTSQEAPESVHNPDTKILENEEMNDTTENINMCELNFAKTVDEIGVILPSGGAIPGDVSVSDEIKENEFIQDNNLTTEGDKSLPSEELPKQDLISDNMVDKSISEDEGTNKDMQNNEFVDNCATEEITSCETLKKDDQNSDDTVVKESSSCSKTDKVPSEIETPLLSEKKRGRKPKRKSCPKIKISVTKKTENSGPDSSKNWYVSERKESTDSTQSEEPSKNGKEHKESTDSTRSEEPSKNDKERKESTDSTQFEKSPKDDNFGRSKRGRGRPKINKTLPSTDALEKDDNACFETVAEVHAVDTDRNPSCNKVSSELNANSENSITDVNDDISTVSSNMNNAFSAKLSEVYLCNNTDANEDSTSSTKSLDKRVSQCAKSTTDSPVNIKDEHLGVSANSTSEHPDPILHIKLEFEEIAKSTNEVAVDLPCLPAKRKGRPSSAANKTPRLDVKAAEASTQKKVKIEAINASSSKGIAVSPSEQPSPSEPSRKPATPASGRKKNFCPKAVIVPFSLGWMRELVHRATEGKAGKKAADVYYLSPEGTKLRSMNEVSNYLSRNPECKLTMENFTYYKELVYREPFEIERSAKQKPASVTPTGKASTSNQTSIKKFLHSSTTPASAKLKKKVKTPVSNSGNVSVIESEKNSKLLVESPVTTKGKKKVENDSNTTMDSVKNIESTGTRPSRKIAKKVPFDNSLVEDQSQPRPKRGRPSKSLNTSVPESEITKTVNVMKSQSDSRKNTVTESSSFLSKNIKSTTMKGRPKLKLVFSKNTNSGEIQPPCSPRCYISGIQRPTVQCAVCLCLFHPNCIPKLDEKVIFACKPCATQKMALYEKARRSSVVSEPSPLSAESVSYESDVDISLLAPEVILNEESEPITDPPDIDISLLAPEVILNVQNEPITLPPVVEYNTIPQNSSHIPQGLPRTISSSSAVNSLENRTVSTPHLLSHLLQPTALLPGSKPSNLHSNKSPTRLLLTREAASQILQYGMNLPPGSNISSAAPLIIKRLPDGRRIAIRRTSNLATPLNKTNKSTLPNTVSNINRRTSNLATLLNNTNSSTLPNIVSNINSNNQVLSNKINQKKIKSRPKIASNVSAGNVNFLSKNLTLNHHRTTNVLSNIRTENEFISSKNTKSSSTSNRSSESFLSWDMNKLMTSCKSLLLVFKRLSVPDLLRTSQVSSYWKYVASQSELWEKVSFQGLTITNWERCCLAMQKKGTKALDLRGIVHQDATNSWEGLESHVVYLSGIEELIFDQITPTLLKKVAHNMPLLRKLECHFVTTACSEPEIWTIPCEWELSSLRYLGRLVRLKIGSGSRIELKNSEEYVMPYLPQLRHVALTGFNFFSNVNLESLSKQKELISLELGDCKEIEPGIYALIENLTRLKSLRLENGGNIDDCRLSETLLNIKGLEVLELMNFKISEKLSEAFGELKHLIHLNVWPDNTEKAAVVNRNLFNAISSCKDLKYLCWGVISEDEDIPEFLEMEDSNELTFENLFNDLVALFPECRVEVKCAPRKSWREFCSTRK